MKFLQMSTLLIFSLLIILKHVVCNFPITVKNIKKNDTFTVECDFNAGFKFCFATYILRDKDSIAMSNVKSLNLKKIKFEDRKVKIEQVDENNSGFYACQLDCSSIYYFNIFYLQPIGIKEY